DVCSSDLLSVLNFFSASAILRESLAVEHRTTRPLFDLGHMVEALARKALRPLMLVWFLAPFAFAGYTVALPLHTAKAFAWGARELGWLFVVIGAIAALVQGFLFGRIERHTGARALLIIGLFGMGVSIAALPWAGTSLLVYAWTVPLAFTNSLFAPAASGLVSLYADPTEQRTILGAVHAVAPVAGTSKRHGSVKDGTALTDYTPDEIERKYSINLALAVAEWMDAKLNLIDTPGYLDFTGEALAGVYAADGAVVVVSATGGVEVGTEKVWDYCEQRGIPRLFFVSLMDKEHANFERVYTQVKDRLTPKVIPVEIPVGEGPEFHGIVNLFS